MFAIALGLSACGDSGNSADETAVTKTVNGLYDAFAAKDAGKVCASLTEERKREIENRAGVGGSKGCERTLELALGFLGRDIEQIKNAEVTDVSIDGDQATATVEYKGREGDLGLTKQNGDWKVSDFNLSSVR
jgi:hypothetical protein